MGYLHIDNLYRNQAILQQRECYALEKLHGTSAHIAWCDPHLTFYSGGERHEAFVALFDEAALRAAFVAQGLPHVTIFGEAYGGRQQKQAHRYGPSLRFATFDVCVGDRAGAHEWLCVPHAARFASEIGVEFVHYVKVTTDLAALDAERDAPSEQARRNGVEGDQTREGVVLRPLTELCDYRGNRIIAKHKRPEFTERRTQPAVGEKGDVLRNAAAIADEWVTPMRLTHVLGRMPPDIGIEATGGVIRAMIEDVEREAAGEIVSSREARQAIGRRAAELLKAHLHSALVETAAAAVAS